MQYFASINAVALITDTGINTPRVLSLAAPDPGNTGGGSTISGTVKLSGKGNLQ
jgi:hypothetical protein